MKKSKLWQAFLSVSVFALAVPAFVQSQTAGGGSSPGSGMSSGSTGSTAASPGSPSSGGTSGAMGSSRSMGGTTSPGSPSGSSAHEPGMSSSAASKSSPGASSMGSSSTKESSASSGSAGMSATADQAKSEADRTMNQDIRKALNSDSSLSASAKNVHFSTDNGKVTLHGTVPTEKDKKDIEAKVEKMTGVKDVDNQLQIAPATSKAGDSMGSSDDMASSASGSMGSKSSPTSR